MKKILLLSLSAAGLGLTVMPAGLVFAGRIDWATHAWLMSLGAVLWFTTAPFWMRTRKDGGDA